MKENMQHEHFDKGQVLFLYCKYALSVEQYSIIIIQYIHQWFNILSAPTKNLDVHQDLLILCIRHLSYILEW